MIFFNFILRYFFENYLNFIVVFMAESWLFVGKDFRNLKSHAAKDILYFLGVGFISLMQIGWTLFQLCFICKYRKIGPKSRFYTFALGLNPVNRWLAAWYYIEFFTVRIIVTILAGMTGIYDSLYLWIGFLVIQTLCVIVSFFRVFAAL